eukprot:1428626-Amphidinium_carterae.1
MHSHVLPAGEAGHFCPAWLTMPPVRAHSTARSERISMCTTMSKLFNPIKFPMSTFALWFGKDHAAERPH